MASMVLAAVVPVVVDSVEVAVVALSVVVVVVVVSVENVVVDALSAVVFLSYS